MWPQPGNIAPPFNAGWVQQVADAAAFAAAMGNKFQVVLSTTSTTTSTSATTTTTTVSSTVSTTVIESTTTVSSTMSTVSTIGTSTSTSYSTSTTTSGDTVTEHVTEFDTVYAYLLVLVYSAIAEYPIGLPLLVLFMIVVYGLIRRKTSSKKPLN